MLIFIEVEKNSEDHINSLYKILEHKIYHISHKDMPSFDDHLEFVHNHPYRKWYLIKRDSLLQGSAYITNQNEIGISFLEPQKEIYLEALTYILKKNKPLEAIKSVRNKSFLVNTNPFEKDLIAALISLGCTHIQNTYAIDG